MYNYNELSAVELSPTKKDYYQVWNELLDTAAKLSERWNPATTNESDPGVVLLKVLTAVADKLSYNIDANTLEAFMPSAAQESSMRKLCEMLGYTMRFYRSATTKVKVTYNGSVFPTTLNNSIKIDRFSNIKNIDGTLNYITMQEINLTPTERSKIVECIEGTLVTCETNLGARVTFEHLDDNYRFYLPEYQVASNQVYVSNIEAAEGNFWRKVENLNTESLGTKVFKFGFDSSRNLPFLQFPEDVSSLIGTGLCIKFIRTSGIRGNVSVNTLKTLETPASWTTIAEQSSDEITSEELLEESATANTDWTDLTLYTITNTSAAKDGKDPETIDEAYWNFQKTIGTFDTLVTCRDYMNKIYQLTQDETSGIPLVSNIVVSDIRDDINRAYSLVTLSKHGVDTKYKVHKNSNKEDAIHYFDLMLYPFVTVTGLNTKEEFLNSFKYTNEVTTTIISQLEEQKTIAHRFLRPEDDEIACIKAYFQLSARLATNERVTELEAAEIAAYAHKALYEQFNLRNVSFGEELPFDLISNALLHSHTKIKNINLDDPKIYLVVCTVSGKEYPITGDYIFKNLEDARIARDHYLELTLKNALAGKLPLFDYDTTFNSTLDLEAYPAGPAKTDTTASRVLESEKLVCLETLSGTADKTKLFTLNEADGLTLSYPTTHTGTCKIRLDSKWAAQSETYSIEDILDLIDFLKVKLYEPGQSEATYTLTYEPTYDKNGDYVSFKLTASEGASESKVLNYYGYGMSKIEFNFESDAESVPLCEVYLNNKEEILDKITVKVSLNSQKIDSSIQPTLDFNASIKFSWTEAEGTGTAEPTVEYVPFSSDTTSTGYVTLDEEHSNGEQLVLTTKDGPLPSISEVTTDFRVNTKFVSEDEPLTLSSNEVIQFRAPSFKTVATYPAYVNYYLHLKGQNVADKASPAIPATMQTLTEFFDGGYSGYPDYSAWNKQISWEEKLNSLLNSDPSYVEELNATAGTSTYSMRTRTASNSTPEPANTPDSKFMKECFTTADSISASSPYELSANTQYGRNMKKYGALFTKGLKCVYDTSKTNGDKDGKPIVTCQITAEQGYHKFTVPEDDSYAYEIPASMTFYGIKIDSSTFAAMANWLQGTRSDTSEAGLPLREDIAAVTESLDKQPPRLLSEIPGLATEKLLKGFYTKSSSNLAKKPGALVDSNSCTYELIKIAPTDVSFDEIYVQRLWPSTTATHTADGLGQNASYDGIPANADYALQEGEYLLVNYSTSEGRDDGTTVMKNIAYSAGTILKANFLLMDGKNQIEVTPYTKTSDFGPWSLADKSILTSKASGGVIPGMFTLGATEQIEIRERIQVKLDNAEANLYWELKAPKRDSEYEYFPEGSYTLQPGEYFYYTDSAKEAMAYYGSGTEIILGSSTPAIRRLANANKLSTEQINKLGLIAAIPWVPVNLSGTDSKITINEFQYINLIEEDVLKSITLSDPETSLIIDSTWRKVEAATYIASGAEAELPTFLIDDPEYKWSVCSRLDLIMSPSIAQTLTVHHTSAGQEVARDIIKLWSLENDGKTNSAKKILTQVYTPLASESTEENNIGIDGIGDKAYLKVAEITFVRDKNEQSYFIPELPSETLWQEACGQNLVVGVDYHVNNDLESTFSAICHAYSGGIFNTPPTGIKVAVDSANFEVDLTGDLAYPRLKFLDGEDFNKDQITITIFANGTSRLETQRALTGKTIIPLTIFASEPLVSTSGVLDRVDRTDGSIPDLTFKACKQKDLVLSNNTIFAPSSRDVSTINLGAEHLDGSMPVITLSALIPEETFGMLTFYINSTKSAIEKGDKVQIVTDQQLAIFNNQDLEVEPCTIHNWTWWEKELVETKDNYKLYTLKTDCINTVVIPSTCTLKVFATANTELNITLDSLKLIKKDKLFNKKLGYGDAGALFTLKSGIATATEDVLKAEQELEKTSKNLQDLLAKQAAGAVLSKSDILNAFNARANAEKDYLEAFSEKPSIDDSMTNKTIAGTTYRSLYIDKSQVLSKLKDLDPEQECYYTLNTDKMRGIELNDLDPEDTLLLAKNWFDKQNIANKFLVSEIDATNNHLENFVAVAKTSLL